MRVDRPVLRIDLFQGNREDLLPLFRIADESESEILNYYRLGEVLVALDDDKVVGMAHIESDAGALQIISLAVLPTRRGEGIGCGLIEQAAHYGRLNRMNRLIVCTGAWETENRAFYAKRGFRVFHVEPGFFTREKGYDQLGDQIQFEMKL